MPKVRSDLHHLFLAFGPDQIELRFTKADYHEELNDLRKEIDRSTVGSDEAALLAEIRLRMATIYEGMGRIFLAKKLFIEGLRVIETHIRTALASPVPDENELFRVEPLRRMLSVKIDILHRIGHIHEHSRNFSLALESYIQALRCYEALIPLIAKTEGKPIFHDEVSNLLFRADPDHIPKNYWSISEDERPWFGDPNHEKTFGKRDSKRVYTGLDTSKLPHTLQHLAYIFEKLSQRQTALHYFELSYQFCQFTGDRHAAIDTATQIGHLLMRRRNLPRSPALVWAGPEARESPRRSRRPLARIRHNRPITRPR